MNDASLVAILSIGSIDVLLPGDAEAGALGGTISAGGGDCRPPSREREEYRTRLAELDPQVAVVSVGEGNSYGHPHPETMAALQQVAGIVLRTDVAGWVSCRVNGSTMIITAERDPTERTPTR